MRLNSMEENYRYKVGVVGSIPTVATKLVRNSIGSEYRSFTPGVESSSLSGPTVEIELIRSIMEVHWSSKPISKSSNLFESTKG